jgi:hypothetical protein
MVPTRLGGPKRLRGQRLALKLKELTDIEGQIVGRAQANAAGSHTPGSYPRVHRNNKKVTQVHRNDKKVTFLTCHCSVAWLSFRM